MDRAKIFLVAGTFGLGVVTMAIVGFLVLSLGFLGTRSAEIAAPLPVDTTNEFVSQDTAPKVESPDSNGGFGEGIKVHGDWTIDVHEPNGTLVSHTEFENALLGTGGRRIAEIIGRRMLPRFWGIRLRHSTLANSPCLNGSSATSCIIYEPQGTTGAFISNNLVVTTTTNGIIRLSGSTIAQRDGQITSVTTLHNGRPCAVGVTYPGDCAGSAGTEVTRTSISPIDVSQGQSISATVEISFE